MSPSHPLQNQRGCSKSFDDGQVKLKAPAAFRGNKVKENIIKQALFPLLSNDISEVERIFEIIKAQSDY